jgi:hypothetical protein
MSSLLVDLNLLKEDLLAQPMRIAAHHDLPFAIFRYSPPEEFELRKHLRLLAFDLEQNHGRRVHFLSMSRLVWQVAEEFGLEEVFSVERTRSFDHAQAHLNRLATDSQFHPMVELVLQKLAPLDPAKDFVFMVRAGGFAPGILRCSVLLNQMHRRTMVPCLFFFPGSSDRATDLNFYDLPTAGSLGVYNYRVKVYGTSS